LSPCIHRYGLLIVQQVSLYSPISISVIGLY
jgi:hypothetical protein